MHYIPIISFHFDLDIRGLLGSKEMHSTRNDTNHFLPKPNVHKYILF